MPIWSKHERRTREANKRREWEEANRHLEKWWRRVVWFKQSDPIVRYTGWLVLFTVLLFFAAVAAATISYFALLDIKAQVEEMQKQRVVMAGQQSVMQGQLAEMRNEKRPWIKIDGPKLNFVKITGENINIGFTQRLKNIGKSPALGIDIRMGAYVLTPKVFSSIEAIQIEVCESGAKNWRARDSGISLMPGEETPPDFSNVTAMQTVKALRDIENSARESESIPRLPTDKASFIVIGCVDYLLDSSNTRGQTFFAFHVSKRGPNNVPYMISVPLKREMGSESLIVTKDFRGNYAK